MPTSDGDSLTLPYSNPHLGKTDYCGRALKEKGLALSNNFIHCPNKLTYLRVLTRKEVAPKLYLTAHLIQHKEAEYDLLCAQNAVLRKKLHPNGTAVLAETLTMISRSRRLGPKRCLIG